MFTWANYFDTEMIASTVYVSFALLIISVLNVTVNGKMYIPPMEPEDLTNLTFDDILMGCGSCERDYVKKLYDIRPDMGRSAQRAVCIDAPSPEEVSEKDLIIGGGPGTTATRSVSKAVNLLGLRIIHYGAGYERDGTPYPPGVVNACNNWDRNLQQYGVQDMYDLLLLNSSSVLECEDAFDRFNLRLYDDIDAVFDSPVHHVTYRLLKLYPNAKVIFTHRDPSVWVLKRAAHQMAMPAVQQPCGVLLESLADDENSNAYMANLELLQCLLPPERLLVVNVWTQSGEEIFSSLAQFLNRPEPPLNCKFPAKVDHCLHRPGEMNMWRNKAFDSCMKFQQSIASQVVG